MSDEVCKHETLRDDCYTAHTRTIWERQEDGTYVPGETEVRSEEDDVFTCVDCEQEVVLDGETMKLADETEEVTS